MSRFDNFAVVSTGDPEQDAQLAADIRRRMGYEAEGLCANGCAPMEDVERGVRRCPVCGFIHMQRSLS